MGLLTAHIVNVGLDPATLGLCALLSLGAIFVLRQFVLHPLGRIPGPFLGRCTNLYAGYHAWRGTLHTDMYLCHQRYGPIVRYGPDRLLINTSVAAKEIYAHSANNVKSKAYRALIHGVPNTLTILRKEDHAWRRRILSLAFSEERMLSYENMLTRHIEALCSNMEANAKAWKEGGVEQALDMSLQSDYFTFDVMSEVIFGMKYNALKDETYRFVSKALEASNVRVSALVQSPLLAFGRLDKRLFPGSIRGRNKFLAFISSLLRDRSKASPGGNGNVFSFLETAKDPEGGMTLSPSQVRAECATLVVAGSDTSSSTLAATLSYLSDNPKAYDRVCSEVRSKFATAAQVAMGPRLNSCTYLRACVDEALRMSPPVGGALWREIGLGGMTVDSIALPAGVDVGVGIYSLHHNEDYHPQPFSYMPERWLVGEGLSTKESVNLARSAFVPFSTGPRSCVGKGFAYHELMLTLAHILQRFDFCRVDGWVNKAEGPGGRREFLLKDHITGAKSGPWLRFTKRD